MQSDSCEHDSKCTQAAPWKDFETKQIWKKSYLKALANDDSAYPNTKYIFVFPTFKTAASRKDIVSENLSNETYTDTTVLMAIGNAEDN